MKSIRFLTLASLGALLLGPVARPATAQEGSKRELVGGILKAIRDAKREPVQGTAPAGVVDLNSFRASLASFRQEIQALTAATQRSGIDGIRSLAPQIGQIAERAKVSDAFLARETRLDIFQEHCNWLDQAWTPVSNQVHSFRSADPQVLASAGNLDAHMDALWQALGRAAPSVVSTPGAVTTPGMISHNDAQLVAGLLEREIDSFYDRISLRQLLALNPQQTDRIWSQSRRLTEARALLGRELAKGTRMDGLSGAHRSLQQEWTPLEAVIRAERSLQLDSSCDRVNAYLAELGELVSGRSPQAQGYPTGLPQGAGVADSSHLLGLATRLEVLAGDLSQNIRKDGEYFRIDALRSTLTAQSADFLGDAQNFRRLLINPTQDRRGQLDLTQVRRSWQETAASWQQVDAGLKQLASQVRRADRYFPDLFRAQNEIATLVAEIQTSTK